MHPLRAFLWLWMASTASLACAQAVPAPEFYLWDPVIVANRPFVLRLSRDRAFEPPAARLYFHERSASGSARVVDGVVEQPSSWQSNWYTRFDVVLPEGTYDVVYHESGAETAKPDVTATILVTATGMLDVVEYHNATTDHYFMTADAGEIANLDSGTTPGWTRTGESFKALPGGQTLARRAMCRVYGLPEAGLDTHFYSDRPAECAGVLERWPDAWVVETAAAFRLRDFYWCEDSDQVRIYRLYNGRPDANHRYTTSEAVRDAMITQGWVLEANAEGWWTCTQS